MSVLMQVMRDLVFRIRTPVDRLENPLVDFLQRNPDGRLIHKWRHYFDIYHRHLQRLRGQRLTLIEIGVFNGGSLRMWRDYFGAQATIVGVDINPECEKFAEKQIDVVIGDQSDPSFLQSLGDRYPDLTILIDDGGHRMQQQVATFEELYPRLRMDGVYICEDTHSSYLPLFGGGYQEHHTFIERMKRLIDSLHAFHSPDHSKFAPNHFTRSTNSMHFYDSVVVLEKMPRTKPEAITFGSAVGVRYIGPSLSGKL